MHNITELKLRKIIRALINEVHPFRGVPDDDVHAPVRSSVRSRRREAEDAEYKAWLRRFEKEDEGFQAANEDPFGDIIEDEFEDPYESMPPQVGMRRGK